MLDYKYEKELLDLLGFRVVFTDKEETHGKIINKDKNIVGEIELSQSTNRIFVTDDRVVYTNDRIKSNTNEFDDYVFTVWDNLRRPYNIKLNLSKEERKISFKDSYDNLSGNFSLTDNRFEICLSTLSKGTTSTEKLSVEYGMTMDSDNSTLIENGKYFYERSSHNQNKKISILENYQFDTERSNFLEMITEHKKGLSTFIKFRKLLSTIMPIQGDILRLFFATSLFNEEITALFLPEFARRIERNDETTNTKKRLKKRN